jgi:hypothetical protein
MGWEDDHEQGRRWYGAGGERQRPEPKPLEGLFRLQAAQQPKFNYKYYLCQHINLTS